MLGWLLIAVGFFILILNIKIPFVFISGPQGWQAKVPLGFAFIILGAIIGGWLPLPSFW